MKVELPTKRATSRSRSEQSRVRLRSARRRVAAVARVFSVVGVGTSLLAFVFLPLACGTQTRSSGAGGECFSARDCEPGLVCVPQRNGARLCSNDLSRVTGTPPPAAEDGSAEASDDAGDGAADALEPPVDSGNDTAPPDTGVDTGIVDAATDG